MSIGVAWERRRGFQQRGFPRLRGGIEFTARSSEGAVRLDGRPYEEIPLKLRREVVEKQQWRLKSTVGTGIRGRFRTGRLKHTIDNRIVMVFGVGGLVWHGLCIYVPRESLG